jgi:hypothetical protein
MTALREYQRLEATALWRPSPDEQRRNVIVSIGEATLTISDSNDKALTHWSLAAVERVNPGERPAIFNPDGDPGETLELADDEAAMIEAIEKLRQAIERARPRPGRLRVVSVLATIAAVLAVLIVWLPDALTRHTLGVVPEIKRQEIGTALLRRIERVGGPACSSPETETVLARLAKRTGVRQLVVMSAGVKDSAHLPGGIILLNKSLIEDHDDPSVAAGYILTERARVIAHDPLDELLTSTGPVAAFRLLTTGELTSDNLDFYAETVLVAPRPTLTDEQMLSVFAQAAIPSTPYAYAVDITGESVVGLIEADPMAGRLLERVLSDQEWVLLQGICGG